MTRARRVLLALSVLAIAAPVGASATVSLFEYDSAVDALSEVDPTITPAANDSGKDFAVGGFRGVENNRVGFSGHSGPLGQSPQGHASETIPGFFIGPSSTRQGRFKVTCVATFLNEAALGLEPMDSSSNDQPTEVILAVRDNKGFGAPDQYAFVPGPASACAAAVSDAIFTILSGNILVHDALPVP
jgi:hypothetical protein